MRLVLALGVMISAGACGSAMAQSSAVPNVGAEKVRTIDLIADLLYDSNIAHGNKELAAKRGITPEDTTVRPRVSFDIVQPIGREAVFLNGFYGYDFHQHNKQLDRQNADLTGGVMGRLGPCQGTASLAYAAGQTEPEDAVDVTTVRNLLVTTTAGVAVGCGQGSGLHESLSYHHQKADNSNSVREGTDHHGDQVSGELSYGNPSLGSIGLVGSWSKQYYPNRIVALGVTGDAFTSESIGVNYERAFGTKLKAGVTVSDSFLEREHAPVGLSKKTSGLTYDVNVSYSANTKLDLTLLAARAYQPSNRPGKLYDLVTSVQANAIYRLGTRITVGGGAIWQNLKSNVDSTFTFVAPTEFDKTAFFGSIRYDVGRRAFVGLELRREEETTNISAFDYTDNRATLSLGLTY